MTEGLSASDKRAVWDGTNLAHVSSAAAGELDSSEG